MNDRSSIKTRTMYRSVAASTKSRVSFAIVLLVLSISVHNVVGRKCVCTSKACKEAGVEVCRTRFSCYTEEIYDIDGTPRDNSSTRGCTEGATPLLCETNAWTRTSRRGSTTINAVGITNDLNIDGTATARQELLWPRLKCCDTQDYCNSIVADHANVNDRRVEQSLVESTRSNADEENSRTRQATDNESFDSRRDRNGTIEITPAANSGSSLQDRETGSTGTIVPDFEDRERSYDPLRHRIRPLHVAVVVLAIAALTSVLGACYVITRFCKIFISLTLIILPLLWYIP